MLTGRRIVVTGASSGIGRALAQAYGDHGALVWGVGRDGAELATTAAGRPSIQSVVADLASPVGRDSVVAAVEKSGGVIDVVVHAAGLLGSVGTPLAEYPEAEWRSVFEVNVTAIQLLHQRLATHLEAGLAPTVIALASTVGRTPRAGWGMYGVSKYALEGWVAMLAAEWPHGRVYSVNPGGTRTAMRAAAMPAEDPATVPPPESITPLFLRLAHPATPEVSGSVLEARDWIGRDPWEGLTLG